ncbi:hypothetical protein D8674_039575 [Pyrus ussuriensis x Pyrus communis]|uniref:Uncharacterized protein n=1 Tax=Pyrus ussuriensis x Pyrus communis TaxID=2448454 RepID=A0A5N5FN04_9ROSA|nr:hypothetical protein D8674_039575 [Pyrus ussuriensis x Pyrus communis]
MKKKKGKKVEGRKKESGREERREKKKGKSGKEVEGRKETKEKWAINRELRGTRSWKKVTIKPLERGKLKPRGKRAIDGEHSNIVEKGSHKERKAESLLHFKLVRD